MGVALKLYEQLTEAGEDKERARLIAEAFEKLEERYPELRDMATQGHVRESELRLKIEIAEVEGRLRKEIVAVQIEIKEVEGRLKIEIAEVEGRLRKDIAAVQIGLKELDAKMASALHRQTLWVVGSVGAIVGLIRLLDFFLHAAVP
ncbi:MAG: DUF1640 domain-containing protein [Pseudomonadota bacterium]|nr:DUF1640 domain-containing protein [Pseudomonadota bacterium]